MQLQHLSHHKLVKSNNTFFTHAFITPGGWTACLCPLINHAMTQQVKKTLKYVCKSIPSPSLERLHSLNIVRISHALHSCVMRSRSMYYSWLGSHISLHVFIVMQLDAQLLLIAVLSCICLIMEMCEYPLKDRITTKCKTRTSLCTATEQGQNMHRLWPYSLVHVMYRHKLGGNKIQWLKSSTVQFV